MYDLPDAHPTKVFVGRYRVMQQLKDAFTSTLDGKGRVVLVAGEAGVGKTTLIDEFEREVVIPYNEQIKQSKDARPVQFARAECTESLGDPYAVFARVLDELIRKGSGSYQNALERLGPKLVESVPWAGPVLSEAVALALEKRGKKRPAKGVSSVELGLSYKYKELLKALAAATPLVIFLDDMHRSDTLSANLLFSLSREVTNHPMLILGAYRPVDLEQDTDKPSHPLKEIIQDMRRYDTVTILNLDNLVPPLVTEYLTKTCPGLEDDSAFLARFIGFTEGWPLAMSSTLDWLIENGLIFRQGTTWQVRPRFRQTEIPDKIEAIIETRLDVLPKALAEVIRYASVQGEEFRSKALAKLLRQRELDTLGLLRTLERTYRLVQELDTQGLPKYRPDWKFAHALVRETAYKQLAQSEKTNLHDALIGFYERQYVDNLSHMSGELAVHCEGARQFAKAATYRLTSASRAHEADANREAVIHASAGIADLKECPDELDSTLYSELLFLDSTARRQTLEDLALAEAQLLIANDLALKAGNASLAVRTIYQLVALSDQLVYNPARLLVLLDRYDQVWQMVKVNNSTLQMAFCLGILTWNRLNRDKEATLSQFTWVIERARASNDRVAEAIATSSFSSAKLMLHEHDEAESLIQSLLVLTDELAPAEWERASEVSSLEPLYRFRARHMERLSGYYRSKREWKSAIEYSEQTAALGHQMQDFPLEAGMYNVTAGIKLQAGDEGALAVALSAYEICQNTDSYRLQAMVIATLIDVYLHLGRTSDALRLLLQFEKLTPGSTTLWHVVKPLRTRGIAAYLEDRASEASRWIEQALSFLQDLGEYDWAQRLLLDLALIEYSRGNLARAHELASSVVEYCQTKRYLDNIIVAEAYLLLGRIAADSGKFDAFQKNTTLATSMLDEMRIRRDLTNPHAWIG